LQLTLRRALRVTTPISRSPRTTGAAERRAPDSRSKISSSESPVRIPRLKNWRRVTPSWSSSTGS
jgi:hypothetical protein